MSSEDTKYTKMDTAIALKDIKVGDHVVIHATKKDGKLLAAAALLIEERGHRGDLLVELDEALLRRVERRQAALGEAHDADAFGVDARAVAERLECT